MEDFESDVEKGTTQLIEINRLREENFELKRRLDIRNCFASDNLVEMFDGPPIICDIPIHELKLNLTAELIRDDTEYNWGLKAKAKTPDGWWGGYLKFGRPPSYIESELALGELMHMARHELLIKKNAHGRF